MDQGTMTAHEPDPTSIAFLKRRLCESGWREEVRDLCDEIIKENGDADMTSEQLVSKVMPKAVQMVPDGIKHELLWEIRNRNINKQQSNEKNCQ